MQPCVRPSHSGARKLATSQTKFHNFAYNSSLNIFRDFKLSLSRSSDPIFDLFFFLSFSFSGGVARSQQNVDPLRAHHGDPCRGGGPGIGSDPRLRVHGKRDGPSPPSQRVPPRGRGPPHRPPSRPPRNDLRAIRLQAGRRLQGREDQPQVPSARSVSVLRPLLPPSPFDKSRRRSRGQTGTLSCDRVLGNRERNRTASWIDELCRIEIRAE